ncbi:phage holin family protein [Micromonospora sp. WMMD812]|uniref:phage holin family protein n=1 Tax=Micromonospora sp. WMMD812 TaxID=3015152 RepID=UPI00248A976F|nr:phage holin family protein [Micromonospora sp. WMMD812]WBB68497.1 phage holin family protein [Micromonospora sp. WMMD812]
MDPQPEADARRALPEPVRVGVRMLRDYRPTVARIRALLRSMATSFVVLATTLWLLPGVTASGLVAMLWLVALVTGVGAVLRPLLLALATALGGLGALAIGVGVQAVVLYVALRLDPEAHVAGFGVAFVAAWLAVALAAIVNWLADAGTDDTFVSEMLRLMSRVRRSPDRRDRPAWRRREAAAAPPDVPPSDGLLVIQLDGVAAPLLQWAVRAGNLPTIGGWLRSRSHRMTRWHTGLPATTPAAQAGLLHGEFGRVPAYRWYEKASATADGSRATGRLVVTSRPRDAAEIERRLSTGQGLLRDGGVSISTAFSGDAPTSLLTVSRAGLPGRFTPGYAAFMTSPYGFARTVVLGAGQVLRELHEGRRQRMRGVQPRGDRGGSYLALRPLASLLNDLNVSLIAEQMARGAPVIFCDFVDYDEVAHHAGPARPEAMAALEALDHTLGVLQRLAGEAARRYHLVVLSDHGQSQGATFRQRYGETLAQVVSRLATPPAQPPAPNGRNSAVTARGMESVAARGAAGAAADGRVEQWSRVNTLLTEVAGRGGMAGAATRAAVRGRSEGGEVTLGPAEREEDAATRADPETVVVASGNLAMIYLPRHPGKLTRERIDAVVPGLIDGLTAHPGVGLVVVDSAAGPVALGPRGRHVLRDGRVDGDDPLAPYGPHARQDLLRHQGMDHVGDLVVISTVDPSLDEVAAFEELVGCHGGLGGWQTDALLIHPAHWPQDADLVGPDAVHRQLLTWLRRLGLRRPDDPAGDVPPGGVARTPDGHDRNALPDPRRAQPGGPDPVTVRPEGERAPSGAGSPSSGPG